MNRNSPPRLPRGNRAARALVPAVPAAVVLAGSAARPRTARAERG
ncbi:hypothetical protein PUR28_33635 [Streptomyces sp. BE308]|nr:hypothetical protein [Streptomyces sp. BE308]MEE1795663.1 hypothetical protein [Streptomyces sp. BE308]